MHDTGPLVGGHEVAGVNAKRSVGGVAGEVGKDRFVFGTDQLRPTHATDHAIVGTVAIVSPEAFGGHDAGFITRFDARVLDVGADGQRQVTRQRPRRRGPRQDRGVAPPFQPKAHRNRRVVDLVVPTEVDLEVGQRGGQRRTVGQDVVPLVQQPLLV